ncbi:sodium/calcium exchanger NCL-like [Ipomoea triloba]|uniref:sodium/calcium exchanger NCL-like n=1 Tax=Ipomoea triloba TaxID=35885 RepID=UPI00125D4BB7|nr:sodium/calcium exchanger NCL-like [Ipomoea triloba]
MAAKMALKASLPLLLLFILILSCAAYARLIVDRSSDLVSDGVHSAGEGSGILRLGLFAPEEETCEQSYGFLPCTTTALGNLFLIIVYGYLMFLAATYLSSGSELLLEILGPGLIGGLFLPILGALPDAMLILVSGLSGSVAEAQSQVSVGMGLLAGSTVMLLTVIWGTCVVVGKCDIQNAVAVDLKDTKAFSLTGSGVTTDVWTSYAAIIMAISVIPFVVVQLPQVLHSSSARHLAVLIALILSISLLIAYCVYQVFQPWIQRRRIDYSKQKHVISGFLKHLRMRALGKLCNEQGTPDTGVLRKIFQTIDSNGDGQLSHSELKAFLVGARLDEINLDENDAVDKLMKDFDTSNNQEIEFEEFVAGVDKWLDEVQISRNVPVTLKHLEDFHEQTRREHYLLGAGDQNEEADEGVENPKWTSIKAVLFLLLGTAIAAAFADPLVDAVDNFSTATSIPTFFISFIALPLATNSSEAVSAIIFASRKKLRSASLTFSELYGAVTMNNVLCLSVFLALVYARGLTWDFSSEVLVILIVCIVMGVFGSIRSTFPLWTSFIAFLLYPLSIALVYVLDYVFGWS